MTTPLDGNTLAGVLMDLIGADAGAGIGQCAGCRATMAIAETHVYTAAPGIVARCPTCDQALIRFVRSTDTVWMDLRGLRYLQLPVTAEPR